MTCRVTSAPSQRPNGISTLPRCRARATSRLAIDADTGPGTAATTTSTPSMRAATTVGHSGPGLGISASRSSTMPLSAAASAPSVGTPTTAHQEPAREAAASSASSRDVPPLPGADRPVATAMVLPRRSPRLGSKPLSSGSTGSTRCTPGSSVSPAGRISSARAAAPLIIRPAMAPRSALIQLWDPALGQRSASPVTGRAWSIRPG
jgi:hypothetical protein